MNRQNLERLKQEQEIALEETTANIKQWEKFRTDYKALKSRLKTLPDKVTHDVMVPFGPLAFMPGKLVHTNEILVLLGDNWFVERSAKQACGIIDRRAKSIHKEIENLQKQKELLQPRLDAVKGQFSKETDTFDIVEEYNEEKEEKWKAQHKKNVKDYKKSVKEKTDESSEIVTPMTDKELWDRLDELERIESERREMHKVTSDEILLHKSYDSDDSILSIDTGSGSDSSDNDTNDAQAQESSSEIAESDDEGSEPVSTTKIIKFTHTSTKQTASRVDNTDDDDDDTETNEIDIKSPADIYSQFYPTSGPRSILKDDGEKLKTKKNVRLMPNDTKDAVPVPVAFSDSVVERSTQMTSSSNTDVGISQDKPARMSRFKARQQGLDQT
ncbi:unconventional prefoldin RPB5 interactor 1-like [Mytilus californianus]|uniref:unconventional prefoldin RPB5 interactor 1-like n=1 Tax=Mytilus californianus TaxID=6549 RepID=UPI002246534F|nr:unconventional prefoldin RPB5 interactor 1-like [Mytilus californianus]